ncbi:CRTAC1 family protein [soil metagenome]
MMGSDPGDTVPEDDRIIGSAFRWSMAVIVALALAGGAAYFVATRPAPPEHIIDAEPGAPRASVRELQAVPVVPFEDVTAAAGIEFVHHNGAYGDRLLPETMGGGVAFVDIDSDGDPDLLFVNGRDWPWHETRRAEATAALYLNRGDGSFEQATGGSGLDVPGYGMGIAVGDYDADGLRDVFITAVGENRLFRNVDGRHFADVTAAAGVAGAAEAWTTSAAFLDYDRDGDLDLFATNYVEWSREIDFEVDYRLTGIGRAYGPPTNFAGTDPYLYRNDGGGRFVDVSAEAGVRVQNEATGSPSGKGLAVAPIDIDGDGWLDLAVANDTVGNFLYHNLGGGRFEEIGAQAGFAYDTTGSATGAMGIDAARYDGDLAVAIGNFANEMTSFYVAQANVGLFTDEAIVTGIGPVSRQRLSFGLFFFDYDLDGRQDLLQVNGHVEDEINSVQSSQTYAQPAQLFWNCGRDCPRNFVPVPPESMGALARPAVGRGAAYADLEGDGDLDVVLTQIGRAARLLRNDQATGHHWLRVRLVGQPPNVDAIGAVVELDAGGVTQYRQVMPARSYLSQVEFPVTFGLGATTQIDAVRIVWPDGTRETLAGPEIDRLIVVAQ